MKKIILSLSVSTIAISASLPAMAQDKEPDDHKDIEEIVVSSDPIGRSKSAIAQGIAVLEGDRLERNRGLTIGATLDKIPGLSQSSFGPAASRPVIRGLGGDRIRILTAGIGSIDASSTSPDHAVSIDPETAEAIEVLRGPATLLFGNNAVGGVVNIFDGRIPTRRKDATTGLFKANYGTNGEEVASSLWIDGPLGDKMTYHVDFSMMNRGLMDIPGYAESAPLRAFEDAEHDEHEEDHDEEEGHEDHGGFGVAESTEASKVSGSAGVTFFSDNGFLGLSFSGFGTKYGVPGHHHSDEGHEEEDHEGEEEHHDEDGTSIDLRQYRADLMGEWKFDNGILDTVRVRMGYADYEHMELEGDEIGTTFFNRGYEGRVEGRFRSDDALSGAAGFQFKHRDFAIVGAESFSPASITNNWGAFALGRWEGDGISLEAGARIENQIVKANSVGFRKETTGTSFSGSAVKSFDDGWKLALNGFRTERAPNAEELLSFGPHLATGTFEIGDPDLDKETAKGLELSLRQTEGELTGSLTVFYTRYNDFIYQELHMEDDHDEDEHDDDDHDEHAHDEGLPDAVYTAANARFWGVESEINWHLLETSNGWLELHAGFDMVRATNLENNEFLPRIPPLSLNVGGEWSGNKLDYGFDVTFTKKQNRLSHEEFPTAGFVDVGGHITFRPEGDGTPLSFTLSARNLFDDEIRHHTSFTKDQLPEAGRDIRFAMKYRF